MLSVQKKIEKFRFNIEKEKRCYILCDFENHFQELRKKSIFIQKKSDTATTPKDLKRKMISCNQSQLPGTSATSLCPTVSSGQMTPIFLPKPLSNFSSKVPAFWSHSLHFLQQKYKNYHHWTSHLVIYYTYPFIYQCLICDPILFYLLVNLAVYQSISSWNLQFWEVYSLVLNRKRRERWLNKSKWVCLYFIHSTFLWPSSHLLTDHMAGFIFKVWCSFSGLIFWHRHFMFEITCLELQTLISS